jgi:hypothetical protein
MILASITSATSVFSQLEGQRRLMDSLANPFPLQRWVEQQQRQRKLLEDPFGFREREKMFQQMFRPPVLEQFDRQQKLLDELVRGPAILRTLGAFSGTMPSAIADQADQFRDEVVAGAEGEEIDEKIDPLPRLAAEREAILICLARVKESAIVAGLLDVPIPDIVLALIVAVVVIGEVADEILREREDEFVA